MYILPVNFLSRITESTEMSLAKRLHLDEVVTSFPELGPTVPDGGYSWVVLLGVFLVQVGPKI